MSRSSEPSLEPSLEPATEGEPATGRSSPMRLVSDLLFHNWGLKAIAFVLAAVLFVSTRDEVTRVFTVPLKVVEDPDRVLMTELPQTIQVQARGPWTRINRLQDYDFGVATLDLKDARPGPLEIDRAAIVMPSGVVLSNTLYDHVDLRFEPVIEREVDVEPQVVGDPAPDYELVGIEVEPNRWRVRGGESFVRELDSLQAEVLEIQGADHDVEASRALEQPPEGVTLLGTRREEATVTVRALVRPQSNSRPVVVPVTVPEGLDPTGVIPPSYEVRITGPLPDFRVIDGMGVQVPLRADVVQVDGPGKGGGVVEVRIVWIDGVPEELRERLTLEPTVMRVELPAPPAPPVEEPTDEPG